MPEAARHILVLEPESDGHAREWLWHLVNHVYDTPDAPRVTFVVPAEVRAELAAALQAWPDERIRLVALHPWVRRLCTRRPLALAGFARWWVMRRQMRRAGADRGHFQTLDQLTLPFALGLGLGGRSASGILFRPSVHYGELGRYQPGWAEWVRDLRKAALYRLMLLNRSLRLVLTIDPFFPPFAARHYRHGEKVQPLPDPAHPPIPVEPAEAALAERIPRGRDAFVLFGVLTRRKGVLALLAALEQLKPQAAARAAVVLAGTIDPSIQDAVRNWRERLATRRPELWLHIENRRLSAGEIDALVRRSAVILAPYQRFVGSSGVLLWAAQAGRPLLAQDFGLVGRLVREHHLGLAVNADDPAALATAIGRMIDNGTERFIDPVAAQAFVAARTPRDFAALVFAGAASV